MIESAHPEGAPLKKRKSLKGRRAKRAFLTQAYQRDAADFEVDIAREAIWGRQPEEAERALSKALRIEPGHLVATALLADMLIRAQRPREAHPILREAVRRHPKEAFLQIELVQVAMLLNRFAEAGKAGRKLLDLLARSPSLPRDQRSEMKLAVKRLLSEVRRREAAAGKTARTRGWLGGARRQLPEDPVQESLFGQSPSSPARPAAPVAPREVAAVEAPNPSEAAPSVARALEVLEPLIRFADDGAGSAPPPAPSWMQDPWSEDLEERELLLEAHRIALLSHYDDLLCLNTLEGVRRLEFQVETARKILQRLNGRALVCDEVGLGKTIEAGMVIKEYLLRGLVRSVLLLVPPGLVKQWRDEMSSKFSLSFWSWNEATRRDAEDGGPVLAIGSIATARLARNRHLFSEEEWDLVVVDEAHHLRRRMTRSWTLVNSLRKRFLLLLSATPVHGNLMELYELVTLVRPGLLGTPAAFRRRFLAGAGGRRARDPDALREVLSEVMVRNTRSHADVALPRRFASTLVLEAGEAERSAYRAATDYARQVYPGLAPLSRIRLRHLLGAAASGPGAVASAAARWLAAGGGARPDDGAGLALRDIVSSARAAGRSVKAERLLEMTRASSEQMVVFCRFRATLDELSAELSGAGIDHAVYHGGLPRSGKDAAVEAFRSGARILLSTESGGEGRNIQFCRTVINYDLPWDPMLIEQRIGRVHRIGQERDVFVFNLVLAGTLEEELLRILDEKIHLFELIVGEVDAILGHLERREEFAEILLELWAGPGNDDERGRRFESFGRQLEAARASYEQEKSFDASIFGDGLEV